MGVELLLHEGACLRVAELRLGLALELGLPQLDRDDGGESFPDVIARQVLVLLLEQTLVPGVLVDEGGEGGTEPLLVGAPLRRVDRVRVRVHRLGVAVGPLHGDLEGDAPLRILRLDADDLRVHHLGLLGGVQVGHVVHESAVVAVGDLPVAGLRIIGRTSGITGDLVSRIGGGGTLVDQGDAQALVEEGHLLEPGAQGLEVELGRLEDRGIGIERLGGTGLRRLLPLDERGDRAAAVLEDLPPDVSLTPDLRDHPPREGVDHRDAHTVETAGHRVATPAELATGVEDGHDHLDRRPTLGGMDVHRDAAAVIGHPDTAVGLEGDLDVGAVAGERLVHRVVHHLVHQVVKAPLTGRSDVHAGTLPDRLQSLQHGDVGSAVLQLAHVGHASPRSSRRLTPSQPDPRARWDVLERVSGGGLRVPLYLAESLLRACPQIQGGPTPMGAARPSGPSVPF